MDNNKLGTNLAEVGTDAINRADAIKIVQNRCKRHTTACVLAVTEIKQLPPIQPEIVRCEECLYRKICSWEKQGAKFCSFAERREVTT